MDKQSIFSTPEVLTERSNLVYFLVLVLLIFALYIFRESIRRFINRLILKLHLGRPNELQTTHIPDNSYVNTLIRGLGIEMMEEMKPY
jgi:hypothetical protein